MGPTQRLGSRASASYPEQGHCHPRGMATHSCPACLVLSWAQATAGSLHETLQQGLLGGARVETWGWSPGAWSRGWQPEARVWGRMVWGYLAGHRGRARWVSGVGDTRSRAQQGAPPRAWALKQGEQHPPSLGVGPCLWRSGARAPGPGHGGCGSGRTQQLAFPASIWGQKTSVH